MNVHFPSSANHINNKQALRTYMRQLRPQACQRYKSDHKGQKTLLSTFCARFSTHATVLLYWPMPHELDVKPLILALSQQGVICYLPQVVAQDKVLRWARFEALDALVQGPYGLSQPAGHGQFLDALGEIDCLLLPCLAVDAQGYRLGSGQGYYDTTLAHAQSQPKEMIHLAYQEAVVADCFPESHDQQADGLLVL